MVKEFLLTARQISQAGGDLDKFYDKLDVMIEYEKLQLQATLDKVYDKSVAATEKLANAQA